MFDNETHLMIRIFQNIFIATGSKEKPDPVKYLDMFKPEIKDAGLVLEYLGLAKQDSKSLLGWRPTPLLMEIIAKRLSERKRLQESVDDELTGHLLSDAVFGERREGMSGFLAYHMLLDLGLFQENDAGDFGATKKLQKLFRDGYYRRYLHRSIERHGDAA